MQAQLSGFSTAMRGTAVQQQRGAARTAAAAPIQAAVATATKKLKTAPKPAARSGTIKLKAAPAAPAKPAAKPAAGTKPVSGTASKKITAIEVFSTDKAFRAKQPDAKGAPKVLARIEQLRLLSKLEQSGLLSQLERSGLTLSKLEKLGLLSTAESLGVLPLLGDRNFPGTLYALAAALLAAGPAAVFLLPDDSTGLVALQAVIALSCVLGGSAAWGGASLLSNLQKS